VGDMEGFDRLGALLGLKVGDLLGRRVGDTEGFDKLGARLGRREGD
jgi:hypothetical protein